MFANQHGFMPVVSHFQYVAYNAVRGHLMGTFLLDGNF